MPPATVSMASDARRRVPNPVARGADAEEVTARRDTALSRVWTSEEARKAAGEMRFRLG